MAPDITIRLSCPGCEKENLRSYVGARNHFIKAGHSLECFACEKTFKDVLGIIQHYQKCIKSNGVSSDMPSSKVPSSSIPSSKVPTSKVPTSKVSSSNAAVKPVLRSRGVQTNNPEETLETPEQWVENPLLHSLLAYMPATNLQALHIQEAILNDTSEFTILPIVLNTLEQNLILRYLRSRCHSWSRLQTEGYILGSGYIIDPINNKKRARKTSIRLRDFRDTPHTALPAVGKVSAIAIDCEMVGVKGGRQTLAFLAAINFLTGEVLINRYVSPIEDVIDWRSKFSGVTPTIMASAVASGEAFKSWREARAKLWEFMDDSTVLVGQSLNYDLEVLGMSHAKVVDSAILTSEAVYPSVISMTPLPRQWGLKNLAKDLLSLDIQTSNCGHSALEDTYAARDVVIWCIMNPEELKSWAENARRQEEERKVAQKRKKHGQKGAKGKSPATRSTYNWDYNSGRDNDTDDFRLSDLAEELGWPEGYDPWSD